MFHNQKIQRAISAVLLLTFSSMTYAPALAATQVAPATPLSAANWVPLQKRDSGNPNTALLPLDPRLTATKAVSGSTRVAGEQRSGMSDYSRALAQLQTMAQQSVAVAAIGSARGNSATAGSNALAQVNLIRNQYRSILQLEPQAAKAFAQTEALIRSKGLPAEILRRHQAAVTDYNTRSASLRTSMAALDAAANGKGDAAKALQQLNQFTSQFSSQAGQTPAKSGSLPWGSNLIKPHHAVAPARALARNPQFAAAGSLGGLSLPDTVLSNTPEPADLAETDDIHLTAEIRALAASLGNNPVKISNWVRNNIRFSPGYGGMQGAAGTLQSRHGNAVDSASLLIGLYRAANIPARYVYGTIEVPADRLQNWLGLDNVNGAQRLLTQSGIPNKAIVQNGQTSAVQLEHVWVSAFVDYTPSGAAVNKKPASWTPVDPAFKLVQNKAGLDLRAAVSLNEAGVFDSAKQGASCNADFGQHLDPAGLQTAQSNYQTQLGNFVTRQASDIAVGDVLGQQLIAAENYGMLLGSLPYKTVAQAAQFNVLPDVLRWQLRYRLFADSNAQAQGQATAELSGSLARLSGQRITLSFTPATDADAATLASFMPHAHADNSPIDASEFPLDIPGYLIRVKAELRANGSVVASGGSFILGSELIAEVASFDPASGNWNADINHPHAGDYQALVIDPQGIGAAQLDAVKSRMATLQTRLNSNHGAGLTRDDVTGDILHQTALNYFATVDANAALFQRSAGVVEQRLPSWGRAVAQAQPHMALGLISKVSFPGVILDIDHLANATAAKTAGLDASAYAQQSNQRNAAYAHVVLSKLYTSDTRPGQAASAVNVLGTAAVQNQPVYGVTSANLASLLPQISLSERSKTEVQDAVASGYRVFVAQTPGNVGAWSGQALMIEDSASGGAAYRLLDDNGNATAAMYLPSGMGWLAQALPFQAAAVTPTAVAAQTMDQTLLAMLAGEGAANTTRWQFFPAQDEIGNGLFLSRLASAQDSSVCGRLTSLLAANRGTSGGVGGGSTVPASTPVITSIPVTSGTAAQTYQYPVTAVDPLGAALTYRLTEAPSTMTIGSNGLISWAHPVSGSFAVTVRADNGKAYAEQRYLLTVGNEALPLEISLSVLPGIINQGETVKLTVVTNGGSGTVNKTLSVDGQVVALDSAGQATVTGSSIGVHPVQVSASDKLGSISKTSLFSVRNPADTTPPVALIVTPADDAEITAPVNVTGTASDANLAYYQLLLRPSGDGTWREIARGTSSVTNGVLGKLDPTQLQNGIYELWLNVVDVNGQQASQVVTLDIYRDLKIGQFSISFQDLNVEASGIPIRVTRTYDTRRKAENLDFGYGWSVDYQSVQIRKNVILGLQWDVVAHPSQLTLCLVPAGKRKVNVTLPTGKVERFTAANAQDCAFGQIPPIDIRFTALPGTNSTLEMVNVPNVVAQGGQLFDMDNLETWNQKEYKLITEDNYVYYLTDGIGITQVKDPSGNTLTYGQNGIIHSNGQSVAFARNAAGRITAITDPAGKQINYSYDARGDLISVTDRSNATAKFSYNRSHGLTDYTDPRGIVVARYVYDDNGRLVAVYDAEGKAIETTHDTDNNREVVKDRRGNTTTYTYNTAGDVTEKIDALGNKTVYAYDALGNETSTKDALGNVITRSFDPRSSKQLTEVDQLNNSVSWTYDHGTATQVQSSTDARGNVTNYSFGDAISNQSLRIDQPLGRSSFIGFDGSGNLNQFQVAGQLTRFGYDARGNKTSQTDASGNVTTYTYDDDNREISRSWMRTFMVNGAPVQKTLTIKRTLDADGRVIEESDVLGNVTRMQYNAGGQLIARTDAQGRQTTFEYNSRGKLEKTTYPDGRNEILGYDAENNQISATDRQGRITRSEYDALNRLTKTIYPDGSTNTIEYDAVGRIVGQVDANGNRTVNTYDAAGRLIAATDPQGTQIKYVVDPNGYVTQFIDAKGMATTYEYDALNRLVRTTFPNNRFITTAWRADGLKQSETDAGGNVIEYSYGATGQLNQVKQTNGATALVTVYGFDEAGNRISQTDAEQHVTSWEYDAKNRMIGRTLPGSQKETFAYDSVGNLINKTDFTGKQTRFNYDNIQQLNQVGRPDGVNIVNSYTAGGQLANVTVSANADSGMQSGKTTFAYDVQNRVTRQTNPDGSFLAYGYDANGNITQRSTAAGTVSYAYDTNQRISSVTDIDGKVSRYTYDKSGRPASVTTPDGITGTYRFDDSGYLLQLLYKKANGNVVTGVSYTLAANGQRQTHNEFDESSAVSGDGSLTNPVRVHRYSYDGANRLTQEQVTDRGGVVQRTTGFSFDKAGNRLQKVETTSQGTETTNYTYDANDRLTQEVKTTNANTQVQTLYTWDDNGNLKSKTTGAQLTLYNWDNGNHLIEVKQGVNEATAQTIARYRYDTYGNRAEKIEPGQNGLADKVTAYLTDRTFSYAQVVQETTTQGQAVEPVRYVWGVGLIGQVRSGQPVFYHSDGQASVRVLSDGNGNTVENYSYDAFGKPDSQAVYKNAYRYTGEYFDDSIGLQYNRARWYDPATGRFNSIDPASGKAILPITLNKYVYAGSDPVNGRDPSGLTTLGELEVGLEGSEIVGSGEAAGVGQLSATASGEAANAAGAAAEGTVENAIRNCLKPGVDFKKLKLKDGDAIFTKVGNLRALPDFLFKVGDKITYLEVKTKFPLKSAKEAFVRNAKQLQAAIDKEAGIINLSFNKLGDLAFKNRTANLLGALSGDVGLVKFVNGFLDISSFLGEFVLENCL